jgi:ATP-dependent Clp protease ATP-binding subunit ClpA
VLPVIDMGRDEDSASGWANSLKAAFKDGKAQLIWSVSQATYHRWLAKDSGWRRLSQVVWVRQERQKEIPPEL